MDRPSLTMKRLSAAASLRTLTLAAGPRDSCRFRERSRESFRSNDQGPSSLYLVSSQLGPRECGSDHTLGLAG